MSALAFSLFGFNSKKSNNSENFIEYGYDAINENIFAPRLNALGTPEERKGANKDAGNTATMVSSQMAVQQGTNSKGQTCMRFAVAIPSLYTSVVFDTTLTLSNGNVIYGQTKATSAYSSLIGGGKTISPSDWDVLINGEKTSYQYFAVYTLVGIPESEYSAKIEVSATVTPIAKEDEQSGDPEVSEPVANAAPKEVNPVEVYNSANIYGLEGKSPDGKDAYDNKDIIENGELKVGAKFEDPISKCSYTVVKDEQGNISLEATTASILPGTNTIQISSVFIKVGNEVVEYPVTVIGSGFSSSITGSAKGSVNEIDIPNTISSIDATSFANLNKVDYIHYSGTKDEWNAMTVAADAFHPGSSKKIIVTCSDGEYTLNNSTGKLK